MFEFKQIKLIKVTTEVKEYVQRNILEPVVKAIYKETGEKYVGVLYAGVIVDSNKKVNVLEFNCRFGDPECEVFKINIPC